MVDISPYLSRPQRPFIEVQLERQITDLARRLSVATGALQRISRTSADVETQEQALEALTRISGRAG